MSAQSAPSIDDRHRIETDQLDVPPRLLLGPGPSNAHPRVLQAIGMPQVGHLDPAFLEVMDELQELLRYAWQTDNELTVPVSGTGSSAMEAAVANTVEPGDTMVIGCNGYFGNRLDDMAGRYGGEVVRLEKPWGGFFTSTSWRRRCGRIVRTCWLWCTRRRRPGRVSPSREWPNSAERSIAFFSWTP